MTQRELLQDPSVPQQAGIDVDQELRLFFRDLGVWRCYQRLKERREDVQSLAFIDDKPAGRPRLLDRSKRPKM